MKENPLLNNDAMQDQREEALLHIHQRLEQLRTNYRWAASDLIMRMNPDVAIDNNKATDVIQDMLNLEPFDTFYPPQEGDRYTDAVHIFHNLKWYVLTAAYEIAKGLGTKSADNSIKIGIAVDETWNEVVPELPVQPMRRPVSDINELWEGIQRFHQSAGTVMLDIAQRLNNPSPDDRHEVMASLEPIYHEHMREYPLKQQ